MENCLQNIDKVYFIGIGGIGMSALARWFKATGLPVAGYDRTRTAFTSKLQAEGMDIHFEDRLEMVPDIFKKENFSTLVVYTPAVPQSHSELQWFVDQGYSVHKRSQVLGWLTEAHFTIAVGGTHGKTTTSSMLAHLLHYTGRNCGAFLGGIAVNFNSNLLLPRNWERPITMVAEADEYDRSFLKLFPDVTVITTMEPDHLDVYGSEEQMRQSFGEFADRTRPFGWLLVREGLQLPYGSGKGAKRHTFGLGRGDFRAENVQPGNGVFTFDFYCPTEDGEEQCLSGLSLPMPGYHNVENAVAAMAAAICSGTEIAKLPEALAACQGVRRRFEKVIEANGTVYIDDYAHHPTEIKAVLESVKALYPGKKITAVFQPHLFTRTRDFAQGFASSLALADQVLLLEVYPAREQPLPGVNSRMLLDLMPAETDCQLLADEELLMVLARLRPELLLTIGAGDIDRFVTPLKVLVENNWQP